MLNESEATTLLQAYDGLPADQQAAAKAKLQAYHDDAKFEGYDPYPTSTANRQKEQAQYEGLFSDLKSVDAVAPSLAAVAPLLKDADAERAAEANRHFLARKYGKPVDELRDDVTYQLHRDHYASEQWGDFGADDKSFHLGAKKEIESDKATAETSAWARSDGLLAAASNVGGIKRLGEWKAQAETKPGWNAKHTEEWLSSFRHYDELIAPHRALIAEGIAAMSKTMEGVTDDEAANKTLARLQDTLVDMPGEQRRAVIAAMGVAAQSRGEASGKADIPEFLSQLGKVFNGGEPVGAAGSLVVQGGEALGRMIGQGTSGRQLNAQALETVPVDGSVTTAVGPIDTPEKAREFVSEHVSRVYSQRLADTRDNPPVVQPQGTERTLSPEESKLIIAAKARAKRVIGISREVQDMAESTDPIKSVVASTAGTSIGIMAPLALGGPTMAVPMASLYQNIEYEDLSRKYPTMSEADKGWIAASVAPYQAALDLVELGALKRLPSLSDFLTKGITQSMVGGITAQAGKSYAVENLVELAQDYMTPVVQEYASILSKDIPGVDWDSERENFWKSRIDVALGMLPLTLIGLGHASIEGWAQGKSALQTNQALGEWGAVESDRIAITDALASGNTAQAQVAIEAALPRRMPEIAAEFGNEAQASRVAMRQTVERAQSLGLLPSIRRDAEGFTVRVGSDVLRVDSFQEAQAVALGHLNDNERQQQAAIAEIAGNLIDRGFTAEAWEQSPSQNRTIGDEIKAGNVSESEAREAVQVAAQLEGLTADEAAAETAAVLGSSRAEMIDTVKTMISRGYQQASVLTPIEEIIEGRWKSGLSSGHYTQQQGKLWVRMAEEATGLKFLATDREATPREVLEAISKIVVADVVGRDKSGQHFAPGLISRGLKSQMAGYGQRIGEAESDMNAKEAGKFRTFLRAFRALLAQVFQRAKAIAKARKDGELGEDFDAFLDDLMGANVEQRFAGEVERQTKELLGSDSDFADSRAQPSDASNVVEMPDGAKLVGPTTFSITAYHGTPHKVDRFSTAKIGTGEGAQAYGWGLYFAENRTVAETYANENTAASGYAQMALNFKGTVEKAIQYLQSDSWNQADQSVQTAIKLLQTSGSSAGNLYTVELLPAKADFLDWDKPLSEQSEKVKAALQSLFARVADTSAPGYKRMQSGTIDADGIYGLAAILNGSHQAASEALATIGIPGIRYLDGNSRTDGKGSSNYVIFDESLVKILEENGKPLEGTSYSLAPAQDAAYMAAVAAGDMATAQRMVDEAAKAAGYNVGPVWHGSANAFDKFDQSKLGSLTGAPSAKKAFFFTEDNDAFLDDLMGANVEQRFAGEVERQTKELLGEDESKKEQIPGAKTSRNGMVNMPENDVQARKEELQKELGFEATTYNLIGLHGAWISSNGEVAKVNSTYGHADVIEPLAKVKIKTPEDYEQAYSKGFVRLTNTPGGVYATYGSKAFSGAQKAALEMVAIETGKAVYRDTGAKVVKLYEFKGETSYSIAPSQRLDLAAQTLTQTLDARHDGTRKFLERAHDKLKALRSRWADIPEKVSKTELDKQQRRMVEVRMSELEDAQIDGFESLMDVERDVGNTLAMPEMAKLTEHPLAIALRTSRSARKRYYAWRLKPEAAWRRIQIERGETVGGEYDQSAGPSLWFQGDETPDQLAGELHRDLPQYVKGSYADDLWQAIGQMFAEVSGNKDLLAKATERQKAAKARIKAEAEHEGNAWRYEQDEIQSRLGSPRQAAVRDVAMLEAIANALPSEVRGKLRLGIAEIASIASDKAFVKEISKRAKAIDKALNEHWRLENEKSLATLLARAQGKREPGTKPQGTAGVEVHEYFAEVARVSAMSGEEAADERLKIDARIASTTGSDEELEWIEKGQILDAWGGFASLHVAVQSAVLNDGWSFYSTGRRDWIASEQARLKLTRENSGLIVDQLGQGLYERLTTAQTVKRIAGNIEVELRDFEGTLAALLGRDHQLTKRWAGEVSKGFARKEDAMRALRVRWENALQMAMPGLARRQRKTRLWEMRQKPTIEVDILEEKANPRLTSKEKQTNLEAGILPEALASKVKLTEDQGIFITMTARQSQYTQALALAGFNPLIIAKIEGALSPEAKALREFMAKEYDAGHAPLSAVFEQMRGMKMPKVANYSPGRFYNFGNEKPMDVMGSGVVGGGFADGFLKDRRAHFAQVKLASALGVFWTHSNEANHWINLAPIVREMRGSIRHPDVKRAVEAAWGETGLSNLETWMQAIEGNGIKYNGGSTEATYNKATSHFAVGKLAFNAYTIAKQSMAVVNTALDVPFGAFIMGAGEVFRHPGRFIDVYNSPAIQRRLEGGFSPEVRMLLDRFWSSKPGRAQDAMEKGMEALGFADAMFTSVGAAVCYESHARAAEKAGMTSAQAHEIGMEKMAESVTRTSQPQTADRRSLVELRAGGFGKFMLLFMTEARQKGSFWLESWRNTLTGKATARDVKNLAVSHLILAPMMAAISAAIRDWRDGGDDPEDDPAWEFSDFAIASILGPMSQLPLIGSVVGKVQDAAAGRYSGGKGSNVLADPIATASMGMWDLLTDLFDDKKHEPAAEVKKVIKIMQGVGGAAGVAANVATQAEDVADQVSGKKGKK